MPLTLLAAGALAVAVAGGVATFLFGWPILLVSAGALGAIGIFALGLLADLLRQIMTK